MILYIVKDQRTGKFLAPLRGGKSSTALSLGDKPRTFTTRYAAENAARWWAAGRAGYGRDMDGEPTGLESYPVKGRNLSTLRVYTFGCTMIHGEPVRRIGGNK